MISRILTQYYQAQVKWTKLKRMFSIPRGLKVLDIGGGDGPFPRADIVCEKFIGDNSERTNQFAHDRPLVMGDLENLPFVDNAFDFVYCSHILEHASDPSKAIQEIQRIGKRGFVEVPSEYLELAATSTPAHYWTIRKGEKGQLVFRQKTSPSPSPFVDEVFREELWGKDKLYMAFHWKNYYKIFNIGLMWEKEIPHEVIKADPTKMSGEFLKGQIESLDQLKKSLNGNGKKAGSFGLRKWIKRSVQRYFTDSNSHAWMLKHIACPTCHASLNTDGSDQLACSGCQTSFPYIHGVPILLKEHGRQRA